MTATAPGNHWLASTKQGRTWRGQPTAAVGAAAAFGAAIALAGISVPASLLCAGAAAALGAAAGGWPGGVLAFAALAPSVGVPWPVATVATGGVVAVLQARSVDPAASGKSCRGSALPWRDAAATLTRGLSTRPCARIGVLVGCLCAVPAAVLSYRRFSLEPLVLERSAPPLPVIVVCVLGLAVINAVGEELVWRQAWLVLVRRSGTQMWSAVAATSASFGLAHSNGIPDGPLGAVLAGAFGLMLANLRLRLAFTTAVLAHAVVDVAIFSAVAANTLFLPR